MLPASAVVVWEWLNEHGRWRPYRPAVSHHIEEVIRSDPRGGGGVVLGRADNRLSPYIIDRQSMHQFRQDTGTIRPVRRSFYDPTSAPGKGWIWEWENDAGSWIVYDTEVSIALQAAHDRQQPSLDLTSLGFCYLVDFQAMTQFNMQTQRKRRIQRRSDMVYPFVYGPLPKSSEARSLTGRTMRGASSGGGSTGALLGIGVSGSTLIRKGSVVYPSGTLSVSSLTPLGQPCACKQCMLVMRIKTHATASQTLGRKTHATKANHPKSSFGTLPKNSKSLSVLNSLSHTIPDGLSFSCTPSEKPKNSSDFARSLSHLTSDTGALTMSSSCSSPPPLYPSNKPHLSSAQNTSSATVVQTAMLVNVLSSTTPSTTFSTTLPQQRSATYAAPLPPRASLAGLSRPALQRIAMAQSQALVASGIPTVPVKNLNDSSTVLPALAGITGILMSAAGLPVCLTRPPKVVLHPPSVSKSDIKPIPGVGHGCRKTTKKQAHKGRTPEEVVKKYLQKVRNPPEEDCTICMEALGGPSGYKGPDMTSVSRTESIGRLTQCGHLYHLQCLVAMYNNGIKDGSLQCPTCKTIYGVKTGNQPPGKMEYHVIPHSLPGHPDCKTIRIIYNIPSSIQGPGHPEPGKPFTARGFPRHCYLPDNEKGRKVLRMLLVAWDRRLIFSVGTSSTTGESDTVIWNEIHHKTEFGSNLTGHGYPDPGYLDNILQELKAQGITEEEGKQQ
ncbi:E3 ubiquitin-protein ligase DTX4 [Triplophysa dalaica]|uniref:E3 ubiquitin-protein ligase DTX4 n=1 Tax=Triplophysa dalaica TaxID=1582913 RepID=UPI0024DF445F|nr:E3 ubiquitin-protein ligase DTX4 [Triplophysa dalaica]